MNKKDTKTLGVLYCGDLGMAFANLCKANSDDIQLVTTCENRSELTRRRADSSPCEILSSLDEVVRRSDWLISLVPPDQAEQVAQAVLSRAEIAKPEAIFVDGNSIRPSMVRKIQTDCSNVGLRFVDAAIHGSAHRLSEVGVMYLSGLQATELEGWFKPIIRIKNLGDQPGRSSLLKNSMGCLSKSLNALFMETGLLANRSQILSSFLDEIQVFFPDVYSVLQRTVPTYSEHVRRRIEEVKGIEEAAKDHSLDVQIPTAVRTCFEQLADALASTLVPRQEELRQENKLESWVKSLDSELLIQSQITEGK